MSRADLIQPRCSALKLRPQKKPSAADAAVSKSSRLRSAEDIAASRDAAAAAPEGHPPTPRAPPRPPTATAAGFRHGAFPEAAPRGGGGRLGL